MPQRQGAFALAVAFLFLGPFLFLASAWAGSAAWAKVGLPIEFRAWGGLLAAGLLVRVWWSVFEAVRNWR